MEKIKLSAVISYIKGKPPKKVESYVRQIEELPYLSPEYLRGNAVPDNYPVTGSTVLVDDGDLILLWDGSNAGEFFRAKKGILSSTMVVIQSPSEFDKTYFYYALKYHEASLKSKTSGSGIPHVDKDVLGGFEIIKFREPDQKKIASVLSTLDQAIEQTAAIIQKQQRIKIGLMQDLLTRGIDETGNIRSEETHEFKDSPLGRIPIQWDAKPLREIANLDVGFAFRSRYFEEEGVKLLRGENVGYGKPDWKDTQYWSSSDVKQYEQYYLREGDIIIGMDRTFTKTGVKISTLSSDDVPSLLVQRVGRFVCDEDDTKIFLQCLLGSTNYLNQLKLASKGMDIPHLSKDDILNPLVPIPGDNEQLKIAEIINAREQYEKSLVGELGKLRRLKEGLMQDLLTGKRSVEDVDLGEITAAA